MKSTIKELEERITTLEEEVADLKEIISSEEEEKKVAVASASPKHKDLKEEIRNILNP